MSDTLSTWLEARIERLPWSGCWIWMQSINSRGYGNAWNGTTVVVAHRFVYEKLRGPISDGMHICHHCDNKSCVNPDHLFQGTDRDNLIDSYQKRRRPAVLKAGDIEAMFTMIDDGYTHEQIAARFGMARSNVSYWKRKMRNAAMAKEKT